MLPRSLVVIASAWWFPLVMGVVLGTITTTMAVSDALKAIDPLICVQPAGPNENALVRTEGVSHVR